MSKHTCVIAAFSLLVCISAAGCAREENDDIVNSLESVYDTETEGSEEIPRDELAWEWVIKPQEYEDCFLVNDGWFAVKGDNGKYKVIDDRGNLVFPDTYDNIAVFSEGVSAVSVNGKAFFIDLSAKEITTDFQTVVSFSEGLAAVKNMGEWGFLNHDGEIVIDCQYEEARSFHDGLAAVKGAGNWGFINTDGTLVAECQFDEVRDYQEGFAAVRMDDRWGVIDQNGEVIAACQYEEVKDYHEGLAAVKRDGYWGFLDADGQEIIELIYADAQNFSEGRAAVKREGVAGIDEWAYIGAEGEIRIDFLPYDSIGGLMSVADEFHNGRAFVSHGLYCIIDTNGDLIFDGDSKFFISSFSYDEKWNAIPGYVYTDEAMRIRKYGLMGLHGEQRLEPVFDYVHGIYGDYVLVSEEMQDGEWRNGYIKFIEQSVPKEDELAEQDTENKAVGSSGILLSDEEMVFIEKYQECFVAEDAKRAALIYLDEDSIPELLILKDGEYHLYTFDGSEVKAITMPGTEIHANAYGVLHIFNVPEDKVFNWFEYVPHGGLVRVHSGTDEERDDYYLRYTEGSFSAELEVKSHCRNSWYTYDAEGEIANEEFLSQLSALGYDRLIPCGYMYEDVITAYVNIDATSDTKKVLEDFVNGEIDALDHVEWTSDNPEENFVTRSYEDYYADITAGEEGWGSVEYIDFDNDGEEELIIPGYAGSRLFFDVIGDTVYKVLETSSTTDVARIHEFMGKTVIARTDLLHVGREYYRIMEFDACCCLVDWFVLSADYMGDTYTEDDKFRYRGRDITMEEFEEIEDKIHGPL